MEIDEALGVVLRAVRKQRQLSQEALALDAGVERNYVSLIELGRNSPSVRMLAKLCRSLEVEPSEILRQVENRLKTKSR